MAKWYVLQTMSGKEKRVLDLMRVQVPPDLLKDAFRPLYEVKKRIRGEWVVRTEALLPGYLFVGCDDAGALRDCLRAVPEFVRLLGNNDVFIPLDESELAFLRAFANNGERVVKLSTGVIEGDCVVVLDGPLKTQTALIKKIDRHKRLAYLEIEILGRKRQMKVGLEIVAKRS